MKLEKKFYNSNLNTSDMLNELNICYHIKHFLPNLNNAETNIMT